MMSADELVDLRAEVERLAEALDHARSEVGAHLSGLAKDRAVRKAEAERDALQRQVDAVRALVPSPNQPGRWVLPDDEDAPAVWVYDIDAALDAVEPADLSDSVGTNAEPADAGRQPHPTPEADD